MGLFDLLKPRDIGEGVKTCKATAGAVLLDVREPGEWGVALIFDGVHFSPEGHAAFAEGLGRTL